nr:acyltransferase [Novosphingobium hassiacum]
MDAWRGIAAVGVVFHHIPAQAGLSATAWDDHFGRLVDLFFVISGFVIASAYGRKLGDGYSFRRFFWLRWGRVWPLHAAMLGLFLVAMIVLGLVRPDLRTDGILAGRQRLVDLPAALLLLNGFVPSVGMPWNLPSWSVSIEMALYGLAALAWRFCGRYAGWTGVGAATGALVALEMVPADLGSAYDLMRGIAGFGLGMTLHWLIGDRVTNVRLPWAMATLAELGALALFAQVLWGGGDIVAFDLAAVALVGIFAVGSGGVSQILLARPFQQLGQLSYALYMVHVFVIGRMFDLLGMAQDSLGLTIADTHLGGADALVGPDWQANAANVVMIGICLLAAWPAAVLVERPARAWSRHRAARIGPAVTPAH